jgi:hypothetical protein
VSDAAFYTVADAGFFPGAVALLNSLRLTGNLGELIVLDTGLAPAQRALLGEHARLVPLPASGAGSAFLAKPLAHRIELDGPLVILDSDMLVTAGLEGVGAQADAGKICVFPDHPTTQHRWFAEWQSGFGLAAEPRRQTYVNAGFIALALGRWRHLLERWSQACELIPAGAHFSSDAAGPYWAGDQDAFNALLMSEVPVDAVEILPGDGEAYWDALRDVEIVDERTLECRRNGSPVSILHYSYPPKPWERRAWIRVVDDAYVRLLPRVLFADDVTLRLDVADVPPWIRPSRRARAAVLSLDRAHRSAKAVIAATPAPLRRHLVGLRNRIVGGVAR